MNILIGVSGGIAAYKVADLASVLVNKNNHVVKIIMTEAAKKFVTPLTLAVISKNPVLDDDSEWIPNSQIPHIDLAKWAEIFVICPATANTIAKIANGTADNLLTSTYLALPYKTPVILFPAMNTKMWESQQTQENLSKLGKIDYHSYISPDVGLLACGDIGTGKLPSTKTLVESIQEACTILQIRRDDAQKSKE